MVTVGCSKLAGLCLSGMIGNGSGMVGPSRVWSGMAGIWSGTTYTWDTVQHSSAWLCVYARGSRGQPHPHSPAESCLLREVFDVYDNKNLSFIGDRIQIPSRI